MRLSIFVLAAMFTFGLAAHATPITYDVVLTPGAGSIYGGSGSFTLASAPATTGVSTYYLTSGLSGLSFLVDGQTFNLSNYTSGANTFVQFTNDVLTDITFSAALGTTPNRFALSTSGQYAFYYNNDLSGSYGTFSASPAAISVTPEPSSFLLLGTGLFGFGLLAAMRKRLV